MNSTLLYVASLLPMLLVLAFFAIRAASRRSSAVDRPHPAVRTASLGPAGPVRWWWLGLAATMLPIATTAAVLTMRWQTIPARFPIHWGASGQPNGWAARTNGSVFGPLLLAVLLVVSLGLMGELIARFSPGHAGRLTVIQGARKLLLVCSWFITTLLCAMSLLPLVQNPTRLVPFLVVGSLAFSLVVVFGVIYQQLHFGDAVLAGQNATDLRYWKAGIIYFNPDDSALMVPKKEGFGYTLNFGRPVCWIILAAVLVLPLVLPLLLHLNAK